MKNIKDILFAIVLAVCLILFLKIFVLDIKIVVSESMEPTIRKGEIVLISKLAYNIFGISYKHPKCNEIIAFNKEGKLLIKRINKINASHKLYVLGDNSMNSEDSRIFGYINENQIVGRAIFKLSINNLSISFLE